MESQNDGKPVVVFEGELIEATYIKNILEGDGIPVFLENEQMSSIAPWYVTAGGFNPVKVIVSSLDYDQSIGLIESLDNDSTI